VVEERDKNIPIIEIATLLIMADKCPRHGVSVQKSSRTWLRLVTVLRGADTAEGCPLCQRTDFPETLWAPGQHLLDVHQRTTLHVLVLRSRAVRQFLQVIHLLEQRLILILM